jgi:peptidoglycan hydrolase-like protein with peptidoglycan-binding domain
MNPGFQHPDVTTLQKFLRAEGFLASTTVPTGVFDTPTITAVKAYQLRNNITTAGAPELTGYGLVGSKTRTAINAVIAQKYTERIIQTTAPSAPVAPVITAPVGGTGTNRLILPRMTTMLNPGSRHPEVVTLQKFLRAEGFLDPLLPVGYFGQATMKALQAFQLKYAITTVGVPGVTGYGVAGSKTLDKINAIIAQKYSATSSSATMTQEQMLALIAQLIEQVKQLQAQLLVIQQNKTAR